jgi:hypothetical protein
MRPRDDKSDLFWKRNYTSGAAEGKGCAGCEMLSRAKKKEPFKIEWPIGEVAHKNKHYGFA